MHKIVISLLFTVVAASEVRPQTAGVALSDADLAKHLEAGHSVVLARVLECGPYKSSVWWHACDVDEALFPIAGSLVYVPTVLRRAPKLPVGVRHVFFVQSTLHGPFVRRAVRVQSHSDVAALRRRIQAWYEAKLAASVPDEAPDANKMALHALLEAFRSSTGVHVPRASPRAVLRGGGVSFARVRAWARNGKRVLCVLVKSGTVTGLSKGLSSATREELAQQRKVFRIRVLRSLSAPSEEEFTLETHRHDTRLNTHQLFVVVLGSSPSGDPELEFALPVMGSKRPEVDLIQQWVLDQQGSK